VALQPESEWVGQEWISCLSHFPFLEVLVVKSPLLLTPVSAAACFNQVKQWIDALPSIVRVYLAHGYDDHLNIGGYESSGGSGFSQLYRTNKDGIWSSEPWRQQTHRFSPHSYLNREKVMKMEDRCGFNSEVYNSDDQDSWQM